MKVTKDVVNDLLPSYLAGEASADTRALVEEFLAGDPELAREAERLRDELVRPVPVQPRPGHEREVLDATRRQLRRQSWLLALAIFLTGLPFSFVAGSGTGFEFFIWRRSPALASLLLAAGVAFWVAYAVSRARLGRGRGGR